MVHVHTKMRVVENFGQPSKVMYKNVFADLGNTLQVPNLDDYAQNVGTLKVCFE